MVRIAVVEDNEQDRRALLSCLHKYEKEQKLKFSIREFQDGEDIEALAKEYGVDKVSGEQSNMDESFGDSFTEYAKNLKEGEYSPVIDIASCYAIVKMVKENNEELADQVMERYRSDLEKDALQEQRTKWYQEADVKEASFIGNTWKKISLYDFVKYVEE